MHKDAWHQQICEMFQGDVQRIGRGIDRTDLQRRYAEALDRNYPSLLSRICAASIASSVRQSITALHGYVKRSWHAAEGLDELLADCFALATWHRWQLPVTYVGEEPCQMTEQVQGLLGHATSKQGAAVFCLTISESHWFGNV